MNKTDFTKLPVGTKVWEFSSRISGIITENNYSETYPIYVKFDDGSNDTFTKFGYVAPEDTVEMVPKIAEAYDEPFGNSSALPAYFCAKLAKDHGIERLLDGDGGDELFAGNTRYIKQEVFEYYNKIPKTARSYVIDPLTNLLPKMSLSGKLKSYVRQARVPLPDRLQS